MGGGTGDTETVSGVRDRDGALHLQDDGKAERVVNASDGIGGGSLH